MPAVVEGATVISVGGDGIASGPSVAMSPEIGGFRTTPVHARNRLAPGKEVEGPAIIEEAESTVVVGPRARVAVDETGNLVMHLGGKRAQA